MGTLDPRKLIELKIYHMNIFHMKISQIMACDCILENQPSTYIGKIFFCLYMIDTLMHYPETPSTRQ